jgi:Fibronectin type III domain
MPTISQLPSLEQVTASDQIPVSQIGETHSVSVGTLLASMQPAVISESGTLLGRISLGAGGPESIAVGQGLVINDGTLATSASELASYPLQTNLLPTDQVLLNSAGDAKLLPLSSLRGLFSAGTNVTISSSGAISAATVVGSFSGIASLGPVTSLTSSDLVAVNQGGADHAITYQNFLDGQTIDTASAAAPASDTDVFWVGQGSSSMAAQTFAAAWTWIKAKLPSYRRPVVEITINTTLDGTLHNGAILVCSQPVTLTPAFVNMGSGFTCSVVNVSGGNVTFATGITTSTGSQLLAAGQAAELRAFSCAGGNVVFAGIAGGAPVQPPGQVTGLAIGVTMPSSIALSWQPPGTGSAPTSYTVNFRVTSVGGAWTAQDATGTSLSVIGLTAATQYDFAVIATNAAGSSVASSIATGTTQAAPTQAPGQVAALTATGGTVGTVNLSWTAPGAGGAVASYTAQYRVTGGTGWDTAAAGITGTAYQVTGLSPATAYDFQVFGVNAAGSGTPSAVASTTTIVDLPGRPTGLTAATATVSTIPLSWTTPATGGAVSTYSVRWSPHNANIWTTMSSISGTSTTVSGLTANTSYDFEVQAVNAGGSSAWTAPITAVTAGNYLLTAGTSPTAGATWPRSTSGIAVNVNDNSVGVDGSHTIPVAVLFGWSLSNTIAPTGGLTPASGTSQSIPGMTGHNLWYLWTSSPASAGAYYFWAIGKDSGGAVIATYVSPSAFAVT